MRCPFCPLADSTLSPIFLPSVPLMNPRMLCGCQSVAAISSCIVAPLGRFSNSTICAVLLPSRVPLAFGASSAAFGTLGALAAFFGGVAFFPDLPLADATWAPRAGTRGFFRGFRLDNFAYGLGRFSLFCSRCRHFVISWRGHCRGHDMNHSGSCGLQGESGRNQLSLWNGHGRSVAVDGR